MLRTHKNTFTECATAAASRHCIPSPSRLRRIDFERLRAEILNFLICILCPHFFFFTIDVTMLAVLQLFSFSRMSVVQ
jgi:hypothetical protein